MSQSSARGTDGSLDLYLREIGTHPLLTREEEVELARRIRAGDEAALQTLVRANLRFVVSVAKRYRGRGVALPDLVNEGNLGLMRAAGRFDESKGVRFISYAVWWIRQAMLQAVAEQSRIVRVPMGRVDRANRVARRARALAQRLGRRVTPAELAAELSLAPEQVEEALAVRGGWVSLDAPVPDGEDISLLELIPDAAAEGAAEAAQRGALREALEAGLSVLPGREARVLREYFGLDGDEPRTLEAIGRDLGVSRERVRQIKDRALQRLRRGVSGPSLRSFMAGR